MKTHDWFACCFGLATLQATTKASSSSSRTHFVSFRLGIVFVAHRKWCPIVIVSLSFRLGIISVAYRKWCPIVIVTLALRTWWPIV